MTREHKTNNFQKSKVHFKLIMKTKIGDTKLKGEQIAILNFEFLRLISQDVF